MITKVEKEKYVDKSSTGFNLPGYKLRWLGASQSEANPGRIWKPLRESDFDLKVLKKLKEDNNFNFDTSKGGTLRRGDTVLGYASMKDVMESKKELKERAKESAGAHTIDPKVGEQIEDKVSKFKAGKDAFED